MKTHPLIASLTMVVLLSWPAVASDGFVLVARDEQTGAYQADTPLVAESVDLVLDCGDDPDASEPVECALTVSYVIANPGCCAVRAVAATWHWQTHPVAVEVDGKPIRVGLPEDIKAAVFGADSPTSFALAALNESAANSFELAWEAGEIRRVVLRSRARLAKSSEGRRMSDDFTLFALKTRHMWLATRFPRRSHTFVYDPSYSRSFARLGKLTAQVTYPRAWTISRGVRRDNAYPAAWIERSAAAASVSTIETDLSEGDLVLVDLEPAAVRPPLWHGGPFVGVGGMFDEGLLLRGGYELGRPHWLVYSANVDVVPNESLVLSPAVEAVTPLILGIPSFGVGLGVPVQVSPQADVGVRILLSAQEPVAGFVASFDIYPARPMSRALRVGLLGRLSF